MNWENRELKAEIETKAKELLAEISGSEKIAIMGGGLREGTCCVY